MGARIALCCVLLSLVVAGPAGALRRTASPAPTSDRDGPWLSSGGVTVSYYNVCTGWTWTWDNYWAPPQGYGVVFDPPEEGPHTLAGTWEFCGAGYARGYLPRLEVYSLDESGVPDVRLASRPYDPVDGWTYYPWDLPVDGPVFVYANFDHAGGGYYAQPVTDHPAAGPDGSPPACGTCYPSPRDARSRIVYEPIAANWPGEPFEDGSGCEAELLWQAVFSTAATGASEDVETTSWGRLRDMYR
jgi:hypothetical protein